MLRGLLCSFHQWALSTKASSAPQVCVAPQFIKALPHTFPHSTCFCHLIKDPLTSRRKGTETLEGVDKAINQWSPHASQGRPMCTAEHQIPGSAQDVSQDEGVNANVTGQKQHAENSFP